MKMKNSTIDEICNVEYGTRVTRKKDGGNIYPVYGGGGETFFLDKTNRKNRIVIARFAMSKKCTRFVKGDFFLNDSGLTLSPKTNELSQNYLDSIILALNNTIYDLGNGTAQRNLDMKQFRLLKISYPDSLSEQESIVAKLGILFTEIKKITDSELRKKETTKSLIEKINDNIFDKLKNNSKSVKLSSVMKFINGDRGKNYPSKKYQLNVGIPFINAGDLSLDGEITTKGMVYLSDDRFNLLGSGKIELNDILFCLRGSLGKCALNKTHKRGAIASSLVIMRAEKKKILPKFVLAYLRSGIIKKYIRNTASGTAQPNLSGKTVSNYEIPLPSIEEQELVLNKIENIKKKYFTLREINLEKKDILEKLKSSFLLKKLSNKAA